MISHRPLSKIILAGGAASGKDYFRNYCHQAGLRVGVSYTTRPKRDGEVDGYTYHYVSSDQFFKMLDQGRLYEHISFNGWQYGQAKKSMNEDEVFIFTPSGIDQLQFGDRLNSLVVYFDIPMSIREERLKSRMDTSDKIKRRMKADFDDFQGFSDFDIRVTKPDFDPEYLLKICTDQLNGEIQRKVRKNIS